MYKVCVGGALKVVDDKGGLAIAAPLFRGGVMSTCE